MSNQTSYKHIKVNAGANDDVVIQAGAVDHESAHMHEREQGAQTQKANIRDAQDIQGVQDAQEARQEAQDIQDAHSQKAPATKETAKDEYQATTLEDIEGFHMYYTQVIVMGLALIALSAFNIWYVWSVII